MHTTQYPLTRVLFSITRECPFGKVLTTFSGYMIEDNLLVEPCGIDFWLSDFVTTGTKFVALSFLIKLRCGIGVSLNGAFSGCFFGTSKFEAETKNVL